jgi:hypothetical protein
MSSPPTARSRSASVNVDGEVETQDTGGLIRDAVERFPPSLFLRDTSLTRADRAIRDFAQQVRAASGGEVSAELHALLRGLRDEIAPARVPSEPAATAPEIFARKRGGAQDSTHVFIGAAAASVFPPATSPATSAPAAAQRRRATTPGPKPSFPMSAGSASIRRKAPARPTPMCASPSASMRSAPPSCAASAPAPATRRSKSRSRWTSERAGCRVLPRALSATSPSFGIAVQRQGRNPLSTAPGAIDCGLRAGARPRTTAFRLSPSLARALPQTSHCRYR